MAARIRKGDTVVVISGVNKGRRGEVALVMPKAERAIVSGVNMATHHVKPTRMGEPGGIQRREAAIHMSNLMLIDPKSDRLARNVHFVSRLMESNIDFVAVDFPQANK